MNATARAPRRPREVVEAPEEEELIEAVTRRLGKDVAAAAGILGRHEGRFLVSIYYQVQEYRMRLRAQARTAAPNAMLTFLGEQVATIERQCKKALDVWTDANPVSKWSKSVCGIGPVLAAGLLAHVDLTERADPKTGELTRPTVSRLWRFAGLDPTVKWGRGEQAPWNQKLKVLTWKIGQSFMKTSGNDESRYGQLYKKFKEEEVKRNESGAYAAQARERVSTVGKTTDAHKAYSQGKLPPAHLDGRARRRVVKLFLAHYFVVAYRYHYRQEPPRAYALDILKHADEIVAPDAGKQMLGLPCGAASRSGSAARSSIGTTPPYARQSSRRSTV